MIRADETRPKRAYRRARGEQADDYLIRRALGPEWLHRRLKARVDSLTGRDTHMLRRLERGHEGLVLMWRIRTGIDRRNGRRYRHRMPILLPVDYLLVECDPPDEDERHS